MSAAGLWIVVSPGDGVVASAPVVDPVASVLPVPGASEAYLSRADALFMAGRLPDALNVLDRVSPGDAAYAAAQVLRARAQRELLRTAAAGPAALPERSQP
jgi:hypothetical protein